MRGIYVAQVPFEGPGTWESGGACQQGNGSTEVSRFTVHVLEAPAPRRSVRQPRAAITSSPVMFPTCDTSIRAIHRTRGCIKSALPMRLPRASRRSLCLPRRNSAPAASAQLWTSCDSSCNL